MRLTSDHILLDDASIVAIDKPSGLATIPGRGETTSALEQLAALLHLRHAGDADPRLRVVHRIDKDTSGVLLFAKTIEAQRRLSHQFQNNTVEKQYLAIVAGEVADDAGEIDAPIAPHPAIPHRMTVSKHGRRALTLWQVEQRFRAYALLRVRPRTGKTHQIRVHLRHIGHALAVDPLYNPNAPLLLLSGLKRNYRAKPGQEERPLIARLTLHAERLRFTHPEGQNTEILAPLPKDFRTALASLSKYAPI